MGRTKHGHAPTDPKLRHPLYATWLGMKNRCSNPRAPKFRTYGARGIRVCERWSSDFAAFLADVGERPSPAHSIERKDNDGHYEPNNVRWATAAEQGMNKSNNVKITWAGRTQCASAWARELGLPATTISRRIRDGWPPERVLDPPMSKHLRPKGFQ